MSGHEIYKIKHKICIKKKVFKFDVEFFHPGQPNCKLDSYERATKKEI